RSAFGFGGQKCSANSRVYVEREVYDDFVKLLKDKTEKLKVGNPIERDVFMGPVVNEEAMNTFEQAAGEAKKNGNVITGPRKTSRSIGSPTFSFSVFSFRSFTKSS
ncbi:MAG TPA: aldehyde dehydrogenase family protein, partial [Actinomycetota bacterium]|nr:aldehyde dehydrogenase family protein [Actinomycetota bacterium]